MDARRASVALGLMSVMAATVSHSATRYVPADYPTIQAALNASSSGDEVLVAPGTYDENLIFGGAQDGVHLKSIGGAVSTIIDGGRRTGSVVSFSGVGPLTRLEGFTLTRGGADPPAGTIGGGISFSGASPTIESNIIRENYGEAAGGLYIDASSPTIIGNEIRDNHAPFGSGGGIYCDHVANPRIERNVILANSCAAYGGGVTVWEGSSPQLIGNTIVANTATLGGGGVYVVRNSHPQLGTSIVAWNVDGGGVVVADGESTLSTSCVDVFGNAPDNYSGVPDPTGSDGNISVDPLFCHLGSLDLGLTSVSPCAPAHSPAGCSLIGALDVTCAPTIATRSTWGDLKTRYR